MDNVADLPWTTLKGLVREVSGVGLVQLTLQRALHARLQAELEERSGRSSKSGSRASSRAGSRSEERSGFDKREVVPPQVTTLGQQQRTAGELGGKVSCCSGRARWVHPIIFCNSLYSTPFYAFTTRFFCTQAVPMTIRVRTKHWSCLLAAYLHVHTS